MFGKLIDIVKKYKKMLMIAFDIAVVPGLFILKYLSSFMLSTDRPCVWTELGLQCATCGGTRCVNSLLSGNFIEAIKLNPFVVVMILFVLVTFLLLNLLIFRNSDFAKRALKKMYSLWSLVIILISLAVFFIGRNIYNVIVVLTSL